MYASLQDQKLTNNNYKNMIMAWFRSHCIVIIYVPFVSFPLKEGKNTLLARNKNEY